MRESGREREKLGLESLLSDTRLLDPIWNKCTFNFFPFSFFFETEIHVTQAGANYQHSQGWPSASTSLMLGWEAGTTMLRLCSAGDRTSPVLGKHFTSRAASPAAFCPLDCRRAPPSSAVCTSHVLCHRCVEGKTASASRPLRGTLPGHRALNLQVLRAEETNTPAADSQAIKPSIT